MKKRAEGFYYGRVFREDEMVEFLAPNALELTTRALVRSRAVSNRVRSYDGAQQMRPTELEKKVKLFEGDPAVPKRATW